MNKHEFLTVIDATPLVSIDLIIENQQGCILLGRRNNRPARGYWFVPGGRIRKNETLADAMQRISATELGTAISIRRSQLLGAYDHIYEDNYHAADGINTHYVALGYKIRMADDFKIQRDDQHSALEWWPRERLLGDPAVHANTKLYLAGA